MAITADYSNKIIHSDASITDLIAFHGVLRNLEADSIGMLYPVVHTYKEVPLGGGAIFPAIAFINGWTLQFPAGNFIISGGNMSVSINPVAGCYVYQTQSAAYAVTAVGSGGGVVPPTVQEIRQEMDNNSIKLNEIHKIQGLDATAPLTVTKTLMTAGAIDLELSGDGEDITIVTRQ